MNIRMALGTDLASIRKVIEAAFSDEENKVIGNVAADLASDTTHPSIKSLIAEVDNQVVGYVSYSPIFLSLEANISGYILSPLAVAPEHQKQGIGANLIKAGIDMLNKDGIDVLLVYGDHKYYGQFGFEEEIGRSFVPPYPLEYTFGWLAMMLNGKNPPDIPVPIECVAALSKPDLW